MNVRVERVITEGVMTVGGEEMVLSNNVWIVGDDDAVVVIDAAHDAQAIMNAIGERRVEGIVITHGHGDHINAAPLLRTLTDSQIWIHPADRFLWDPHHPGIAPDGELEDGQIITIQGVELEVLHTPGHTPGAISLSVPALGCVFTGDTLFENGPGATRHDYSSYPAIVNSIRTKLFPLSDETVVHTGHGPSTTIGAERGNVPDEKPEE